MSERVYQPQSNASEFLIGEWRLCVRTNSLLCGDTKVELENRLVMLLLFFIDNQGEILDKERIIKAIWQGKVVNEDSLAVAISNLRKALGDSSRAPTFIKTIPGVGYQFIGKAEAFPAEKVDAIVVSESLQSLSLSPKNTSLLSNHALFVMCFSMLVIVLFAVVLLPKMGGVSAIDSSKSAAQLDASTQKAFAQAKIEIASWEPELHKQAIQTLRNILTVHPDYAPAYISMADAKIKLLQDQLSAGDNCAEVLGLLNKAINLDQQQASAWLLRGNTLFWCKRDYLVAEKNYQQAIQLNATDDQAPMQYAQLLLAQGRFAESLQQVERARQLNPLHYSIPTVVWIYQMQRRDDLALQELQRIATTEPDNRYTHISAQRVYESLGRAQESFEHWLWLMRAAGYSEDALQQVEQVFAQTGLAGVNRWLLERGDFADLGQYTPPLSWARYALAAGELGRALDYIEQAFAARQSPLLWANVDPAYDALRNQPRFQAIITQLQTLESPIIAVP